MPDKKGRATPMERIFVKQLARTNDAAYAATKAGYASPEIQGPTIAAKPAIAEMTREEVQRFLRDDAPALGVGVIAELATSPKVADNTRLGAAKEMNRLSGIGVKDGDSGKELYEMNGQELAAHGRRLAREHKAIDSAIADRARVIIEHESEQPNDVMS